MITATEIKQKAVRFYADYLRSIIQDESVFPKEFAVGKLPEDYIALRDAVLQLIQQSKERLGYGYTIELTTRKTRKYGDQSLPTRIVIETEADYLKLIQKEKEVALFQANVRLIRLKIPELSPWLTQHPLKVIEFADQWEGLLKVCEYFRDRHWQSSLSAGLYIRELPISVPTKFIESHKGILRSLLEALLPPEHLRSIDTEKDHTFEKRFCLRYNEPLIRLRILDRAVQTQYHLPISDFSSPISELEQLEFSNHQFIITENLMNFLTLPPLKNSVAIFGSGFGIQTLRSIAWLSDSPIFYWGDLDSYGFRILAQLRSLFPQVISIMMNLETFKLFEEFAVKVEEPETENPTHLTADEIRCYQYIVDRKLRLEQERISQSFAIEQLEKAVNSNSG